MKFAAEVMGGDFAPKESLFGAFEAAKEYKYEITLVDDETKVLPVLERCVGWKKIGLRIHHASQVIEMTEHPGAAVKKDGRIGSSAYSPGKTRRL